MLRNATNEVLLFSQVVSFQMSPTVCNTFSCREINLDTQNTLGGNSPLIFPSQSDLCRLSAGDLSDVNHPVDAHQPWGWLRLAKVRLVHPAKAFTVCETASVCLATPGVSGEEQS